MIPALLFPVGLAALAALLLPLLLHLARRTQQRPTDFAALRWLRQKPRPRHRPRLDEWPLLLVRLLLLALFALWLARPVLLGSGDMAPRLAVVPGVDPASVRPVKGTRAVWLAPGFPPLDAPSPAAAVPIASLLRELDTSLPAGVALTVLVPAAVAGADGERPRLSRAVGWRIVPGAMTAAPAPLDRPPALAVRRATGREAGAAFLRAAATSWTSPGRAPAYATASTVAPVPPASTVLVWLAPGPLPTPARDWIASGGTALLAFDAEATSDGAVRAAWRDESGAPLVEEAALARGRVLRFTRPLAPAAMPELLRPDFPQRLRALLSRAPPAPSRVLARDYAPTLGGPPPARPARDLQPWLALAIAAVLLAERWLATRRRRAVAP